MTLNTGFITQSLIIDPKDDLLCVTPKIRTLSQMFWSHMNFVMCDQNICERVVHLKHYSNNTTTQVLLLLLSILDIHTRNTKTLPRKQFCNISLIENNRYGSDIFQLLKFEDISEYEYEFVIFMLFYVLRSYFIRKIGVLRHKCYTILKV